MFFREEIKLILKTRVFISGFRVYCFLIKLLKFDLSTPESSTNLSVYNPLSTGEKSTSTLNKRRLSHSNGEILSESNFRRNRRDFVFFPDWPLVEEGVLRRELL